MGFGCRYWKVALHVHGYQKVILLPLWKQHSVLKVPQNSSNSNHAQSDKCQLSVMLLIAWCVVITQYWFSKQEWKLLSKYLMIFSHCVIQFCEFGFHCCFQTELVVDKVHSLLPFMHPILFGLFGASLLLHCVSFSQHIYYP